MPRRGIHVSFRTCALALVFAAITNTPTAGTPSGLPTPYGGAAVSLPGTIEAENFDNGGPEVAYHDRSTGNSGGAYRDTDVDLEATTDAGGGYNVGWVSAGEWLNYTVDVQAAGRYTIAVRVASPGSGGTFHVELNGEDKTGPIQVPDTTDWQTWTTVSVEGVLLAAGTQALRLVMDTSGESAVGNFNWISATLEPGGGSTPFSGAPVSLPGTIEAEDFDNGGAGIAYHDRSPDNSGGAYRDTDVDLEATTDAGGGYNVGWVSAGEWLNYTVHVAAAGRYTVDVRVASPGPGGTFHIELNGIDKTGPLAVPETGDWQTWTTVSRTGVLLDAGTQVLRLVMDGPAGGTVGNFNWIRIQPEGASAFAIVEPAPGSTLRTVSVTFRWNGAGDEHWLNIGRTSGASDLYASGSLGAATTHTVERLPLNGRTLYVQVRRRVGAQIETLNAQYTAPIRKGLAVITDFANRTLETWDGAGMQTVDHVSAELRRMEAHWAWLSRGLEKFQWDIIRIELPVAAVPDAYANWVAFREAAAPLIRQEVDVADYDVGADGTVDAAWLIVSSGYDPVPFAIGGASAHHGVAMFVDGQASGSVVGQRTGNFNHELGHLLGLPDLYGKYGTMSTLTLMANSLPLPPTDFSAYDRIKLGWLTPRVVTETTRGIWLPLAHENLEAIKVPTGRVSEYFLLEYRWRPPDGYGSADNHHNDPYNGLAIYHVLEGSSQGQNPPLIKMEPADGSIVPGVPIDPNDLASPDNPAMVSPFVLWSYYGDNQEVFRVENLAWREGAIVFDIVMAAPNQPGANLLSNASFEIGRSGSPDGWSRGSFAAMPNAFVWPSPVAVTGTSSIHLDVPWDNDVWWSQRVTGLVPGEPYELCGWLKGEGIAGNGATGANVSVLGGWIGAGGFVGTFDWTRACVIFTAEAPEADIACRLGFYANTISGKAWCDDLTLVRMRNPF